MQTFLPYPSFVDTACVLDWRRLGKQRVECLQILNVLTPPFYDGAWKNHPAVLMWKGYEWMLCQYALAICYEWRYGRGYKDSCIPKIKSIINGEMATYGRKPHWLGDESFHLSHRSNLIRKDSNYYGPLWPTVPNDLPYVWPVKKL